MREGRDVLEIEEKITLKESLQDLRDGAWWESSSGKGHFTASSELLSYLNFIEKEKYSKCSR
tara:strand:- start:573 stop:758 length:186 start_codon:yes stop_codon:yes gene_type:complete